MSVPALRFKNEAGQDFPNWKDSTLGEVAEIKRGAASQHLKYVEGNIHGIRLIRINDFLKNEPVYVEATQDIKRFTLQRNDLLIAGTGATAGIVFRVPDKFENLAYSYNAPRIRVNQANDGFIYYYLISDVVLKQQQGLFVGNAQPFLDTDAIRGFQIGLPSLPEQTKIANFLTAVDEKITQLTQKHDLLTQYKKGVMQQIFSQELRFKDDDDGGDFPEWEKKTLGEIGAFQTSSIDKLSRENETEVFLVNYMNVYRHESINSESIKFFQVVTAKSSQIESCNLKEGDILFTPSSETPDDIGHSVVIFEDLENAVFSYHLMRFRPKHKIDILYSHYFCNIPSVLSQLTKLATGSTRFTISVKSFSSIALSLPCLAEQTKIAYFLKAIDEKITITQTQLKAVKQYKQGLLQQMFV